MRLFLKLIFSVLFIIELSPSFAQLQHNKQTEIKNINFDYDGTNVIIFYDLLSEKQSDKFFIEVEILLKRGAKKKAKTISGDFLNVKPGTQKKIL